MQREVEIGVTLLQATECQGLPAGPPEAGRGKEEFFLTAFRGSMALLTL